MRSSMRSVLVLCLFLAAAGLTGRAISSPDSAGGRAERGTPERLRRATDPAPPATPRAGGPAADPQVRDLDARIQALREEFHGKLDPLQAQVKTLRDQYEPQIKDLEDQKKTLVEQGKPPA